MGKILFLLACALPLLGAPAHAVIPTLGLSVGSATFPDLQVGTSSTVPMTLTVTSTLTPWTLRVNDAAAATSPTPGRMRRMGGCTEGTAALASPLRVLTTNILNASIDRADYGLETVADPLIAHGSTTAQMTVVYRQTISASEQLAALCTYGATVVWSLSG